MSAIRLLQILALTAGAAAFAPYAGPDPESFDYEYKGLRLAGFKPRGRDAPAVVFLPYGIIPFDDQIAFFSPAIEAVAQRGFAVALVEYPDIEVYPDQAGSEDLEKVCEGIPCPDFAEAIPKICDEWGSRAKKTADAIKNGLCEQEGVDCSSIAVAGFSTGAGIATALSTPFLDGLPASLNIAAQLSVIWAPLLGAGFLGTDLPQMYHPCFVNGAPLVGGSGPYSMGMDFELDPEKRLSVISELDELFGNPSSQVATSGPVFQLQQLYSAFCKDHGPKSNCIQSSGAGYYVVPAGESPSLFGPPETATPHNSFSNPIDGFFEPGGTKVWQADATFEWLLGAAFGPFGP